MEVIKEFLWPSDFMTCFCMIFQNLGIVILRSRPSLQKVPIYLIRTPFSLFIIGEHPQGQGAAMEEHDEKSHNLSLVVFVAPS